MESGNIQRSTFTVSDFISWMRNGELQLSPSFQRRPVWKTKSKSYFIDTIVRGLPVPLIFLRERIDIRNSRIIREVVDGQQRIRTIISYIDPRLLPDFNPKRDEFTVSRAHNKEISGLPYQEIPDKYKKAILGYQFSVDILPRSASDQDILQIFKRLNSTGQRLSDQELRNAEFSGYFSQLAYAMALEQLERWRDWQVFKEDEIARMEEAELSSEILILMLQGVFGKTKSVIDRVYKEYEDKDVPDRDELIGRFRVTFDKIDSSIGNIISTSVLGRKAIFFSLVAAIYHLLYGIGSDLSVPKRPAPLPSDLRLRISEANQSIATGSAPQSVLDAVARRTTHVSSRRTLINYLLASVGREPIT